MKTQPTLPSSPGHLRIILTQCPIFIAIVLSEIQGVLRVPLGPLSTVSNFQLLVQIWAENSVNFCTRSLLL